MIRNDRMSAPTAKPWDARLAAWLVTPLVATRVTPNHLTTLRLAVGLAGVAALASGGAPNAGALLIALSTFLDHTDGELARIGGRSSRFGHYYDLAADFVVTLGLFVGAGIGLRHGPLGGAAMALGLLAGMAVALMFQLRHEMEQAAGKALTRQPAFAGFEPEDVFYLLPAITLADGLAWFLIAAAVGAPLAAAIVVVQYLRFRQGGARS